MTKKYLSFSLITSIVNIAAIVIGLMYLIQPRFNAFLCIMSTTIPIAFLCNIINIILNDFKRRKTQTKKTDIVELIYLLCNTVGMLLIPFFLFSSTYAYSIAKVNLIVHYVFYFGLLITGVFIPWRNRQNNVELSHPSLNKLTTIFSIIKYMLKLLMVLFSLFIVFLGILASILILIKIPIWPVMFISQFAAFLALSFLSATGIIIKVSLHLKKNIIPVGSFITGLLIYSICSLPILMTPYSIVHAQNEFLTVFGPEMIKSIDAKAKSVMLRTPFNPAAYYLGLTPENCTIKKDVLYYEGITGVDNGIKLYFDAYLPGQASMVLSGNHSIIVSIHGGGWKKGDKRNCSMSKYFASQGYRVFDIQYGLTKLNASEEGHNYCPEHVRGYFSIDDMIRHIGLFFQYLANHSAEYQADLHSVFITGNSAGGHLTCACALAIASGKYNHIFGSNFIIKGYIPFYPANGLAIDITGTKELKDPEYLIEKKSPPCLIYHGTRDSIVSHEIAKSFERAYHTRADSPCLVISMPLGEHWSDGNFSGYYNQVFVYYMERFLNRYR